MTTNSGVVTFADHVRARTDDDRIALKFDDRSWTYREWCAEVATRAAWWRSIMAGSPAGAVPHIGVLLDNTPEFTMWLGAAAVTGAAVVGINPTRRGAELERDITYTDCQVVITEPSQVDLLAGLDLGAAGSLGGDRVLVVDTDDHALALQPFRGSTLPSADECPVAPSDNFLLVFTSGTSGAPKAVITTHRRLLFVVGSMLAITQLTADDTTYISMPLFHSNALFTAWAPSVAAGAAVALRRKFSASEFLDDVRRYGATYFNYVGKPLTYILATPERRDDADNPLRRGFGNEGSEVDIARFGARFGCTLTDGYGQTETGASIVRVPDMPSGSLGVAAQDTIKVLSPDTGEECPRARFDEAGRLLNGEEATGEIVNTGGGTFEGYWNNDEANRERLRNGAYWTGDLAYRDEKGFFYFAGRTSDWLRVDGENFAAAPIERIVMRHPSVLLAAVYGVPDVDAGDRAMVAIQLVPGAVFEIDEFATFLGAQADLGPKWVPSFVEVVDELPLTQTNKVVKRELVRKRWHAVEERDDARVWFRPGKGIDFVRFTRDDATRLRERFEANGRSSTLT
jgi:fatty-acyl-CoA synthase